MSAAMLRYTVRILIGISLCFGASASMAQGGCDISDVANEDNVYQCMMLLRQGNRPDTRLMDSRTVQDCPKLVDLYASIARRAGVVVPRGNESDHVPSCTTLARVMERMNNQRPFWAACTGYPGRFEAEHMRTCLTEFLPRFYGDPSRTLESLQGCDAALGEYQRALSYATARHERPGGQPAGYTPPSCEVLQAAGIVKPSAMAAAAPPPPNTTAAIDSGTPSLASPPAVATLPSTPCSNYEPNIAHLERCLGGRLATFTDCRAMRQAYVEKLRQDNGDLPSGYQPPSCDVLAPIVAQNQARRAERPPQKPITDPYEGIPKTWTEAFWRIVGWMNGRAFLIHMAVCFGIVLYSRHLIASGDLPGQRLTNARIFFNPRVNRLLLVANIAAGWIGYQYFTGESREEFPKWIFSGIAAFMVTVFATSVLIFTPFFSITSRSRVPQRPGPTSERPRQETPPPKQRTSKQRGDTF